MEKRWGIILIFVSLLIGFVFNWVNNYYDRLEDFYIPVIVEVTSNENIPSERVLLLSGDEVEQFMKMPVDENYERSLETYYQNRAYYGAPPAIPHAVKFDKSMGNKLCLQCHQFGGFVEKFDAYTPITPHPELVNCRQCHQPVKTVETFKESGFYKIRNPEVGTNNVLPGSPPIIPHQLVMRENCLACHAGPAAPKEIRVTHPERINCRQCHVTNDSNIKSSDLIEFVRGKIIANE